MQNRGRMDVQYACMRHDVMAAVNGETNVAFKISAIKFYDKTRSFDCETKIVQRIVNSL